MGESTTERDENQCEHPGCPWRIRKTPSGWGHLDTHGAFIDHVAVPQPLAADTERDERLREAREFTEEARANGFDYVDTEFALALDDEVTRLSALLAERKTFPDDEKLRSIREHADATIDQMVTAFCNAYSGPGFAFPDPGRVRHALRAASVHAP